MLENSGWMNWWMKWDTGYMDKQGKTTKWHFYKGGCFIKGVNESIKDLKNDWFVRKEYYICIKYYDKLVLKWFNCVSNNNNNNNNNNNSKNNSLKLLEYHILLLRTTNTLFLIEFVNWINLLVYFTHHYYTWQLRVC